MRRLPVTGPFALALGVAAALAGCAQSPERLVAMDPAMAARAQNLERFEREKAASAPEKPIEDFPQKLEPESVRVRAERASNAVADAEPRSRAPESGQWKLPIEELRAEVLENNLEIQAQLVNPAIAETLVAEADAAFESTLSASIDQDRTAQKINEPGTLINTEQELGTYTYGISVPLRTGATVTASMPTTRTYTRNDLTNATTRQWNTAATLTVSQPLLRDAGVAITEAPITLAMLGRRQTDAATRLAITNLLANAERFYWQHWAAAREVEIRHEQYELAARQLKQAQRFADAGLVPRLEIARSESGLSSRVEAIIVAETRRRLAERELKRVLNVPGRSLDSDLTVIPVSDPRLVRPYYSIERLLDLAMDNRMELLDSKLQLAIDQVNLDLARNDQLPSLALGFDYTFRGINRSPASAAQNFTDTQTAGITLTFSMPLGNGAAKAATERAALQQLQTRTTEQVRRQIVEQDVRDAYDTLEQNWQRILAARHETEMARRIFEAENRQFVRGFRTSTEVLDAAQLLANAQLRSVNAMADFEVSKIELAFATGTHLGTSRVLLSPPGVTRPGPLKPYAFRQN